MSPYLGHDMSLEIDQIFGLKRWFQNTPIPQYIKKKEWQGINLTKYRVVFIYSTNKFIIIWAYHLTRIDGILSNIFLNNSTTTKKNLISITKNMCGRVHFSMVWIGGLLYQYQYPISCINRQKSINWMQSSIFVWWGYQSDETLYFFKVDEWKWWRFRSSLWNQGIERTCETLVG